MAKKGFYKSKDDRESGLRDVRDWAGFKVWFTNVYWYHYRVHTIAGIIVLAFLAWSVSEYVNRVEPDFQIVLGTEYGYDFERVDALQELLAPAAGDLNGDGKERVQISAVSLNQSGSGSYENAMAFSAWISNPDVYLIITDLSNAMLEDRENYYDVVELSGYAGIAELGFPKENGLCAIIINRDNKESAAQIAAAYRVLEFLK